MGTMKSAGVLLFSVLLAVVAHEQGSKEENGVVQTQMHNVLYRFTPDIAAHIRTLGGELVPTGGAALPIFDDKNSFVLKIDAAEIAISQEALANTLNQVVFSGKNAPLKEISVAIEKDRMKIKGKLHSKGDIGFETEGELSATDEGKIRLHVEKVRALHLPVKGLMDLLGVEIADLIKSGKARGVDVEKDDLILDPEQIFPPPHINGRVSAIHLQSGNVVLIFGNLQKYPWKRVSEQNYMALQGNSIRFGKLTMDHTDMVLIDMDPGDPFDFFLDHYVDQLVAGYTKNKKDNALRVFMKDYGKLRPGQMMKKPGRGM